MRNGSNHFPVKGVEERVSIELLTKKVPRIEFLFAFYRRSVWACCLRKPVHERDCNFHPCLTVRACSQRKLECDAVRGRHGPTRDCMSTLWFFDVPGRAYIVRRVNERRPIRNLRQCQL